MTIEKSTTELEQFRNTLYQNFNNRADTLMEVVDAMCSSPWAQSVAELTLAASFRRSYSALHKAVDAFAWEATQLTGLLAPYLPRPQVRPFWLLGVDVTPQPRPFAPTLSERGMVYQPNQVKGNKPVTIGHQYSSVALLPEAETGAAAHWVLPLMVQRVATTEDKELVAARQIDALLRADDLPFAQSLCVEVGDTSYSKPEYLEANRHHANLVTIAPVPLVARSNRTFYRQALADESEPKVGHPTWYGDAFDLKQPASWHVPDETASLTQLSRGGKRLQVRIQVWHNLLMTGRQKPTPLPMHRHPFTLVRIVRYDEQGVQVGQHPLWLLVIGQQRHALRLLDIYHAYQRRYDLEHFFRFGKQKLLLVDFQTPETPREEAWWQLGHIAYAQLWMARHLAVHLPRPWERYLPVMCSQRISPTLVQRDFGRIIRQLGTPAKPPKRRGNSKGRPQGFRLLPRPRHKVVVKGRHKANSP